MNQEDSIAQSSAVSNGMNTDDGDSQLPVKTGGLKILLVVTKADMGGAQKRIIDMATRYRDAGHQVTVASGPGSYLPRKLAARDIKHHFLAYLSRANPLKILAYIVELWNYLRRQDEPFDVVHLNSSSALAGALAARAPQAGSPKTVFTFRGLSVLAPGYKTNSLKKRFYEYSFKAFLPFVDVGVFQCAANQKVARDLGIQTTTEVVISDGIDPDAVDFLDPATAREKLASMVDGDIADKLLVGSIGRLAYAKNYAFLIRQLRKLKKHRQDVAAIIIGDGPEYDHLAGCIHRLGLTDSVFLVGAEEDAAQYLAGFDVFVLPSHYEGLSMTLTEAMHAGVPLLVSDVGCSGGVVGDERMVFQPGDAVEFLDKLEGLLDADDRDELSKAVHRRAQELVLDRSISKYLDLYEDITSSS
ncbi:MAG: glycosyltransferase [Candidatus Paceibacterota bacterium]